MTKCNYYVTITILIPTISSFEETNYYLSQCQRFAVRCISFPSLWFRFVVYSNTRSMLVSVAGSSVFSFVSQEADSSIYECAPVHSRENTLIFMLKTRHLSAGAYCISTSMCMYMLRVFNAMMALNWGAVSRSRSPRRRSAINVCVGVKCKRRRRGQSRSAGFQLSAIGNWIDYIDT